MIDPPSKRDTQRARMLAKIITIVQVTTSDPERGTEGIRLFWQHLKQTVGNLRDMDSEIICRDAAPTAASPATVVDTRANFRVRLLGNILALGELAEMSQTSPVAKGIYWEAIKLELKTLRDLEEDPHGTREEAPLPSACSSACSSECSSLCSSECSPKYSSLSSSNSGRITPDRIEARRVVIIHQSKAPIAYTDDEVDCASTKSIQSHTRPSTGASDPPSPATHRVRVGDHNHGRRMRRKTSRRSGSDHRHKHWRKRVRCLPSILSPASPRTEWLSDHKHTHHPTVQETETVTENTPMEMVFFKTIAMQNGNHGPGT